MRFLALGDSYTIGEGVAAHERWPVVLVDLLRARNMDVRDAEIVARTAWTTDELLDAMDEARPVGPYDLVTLLIGVNDQYRARPVEQFETGFRELIARAIAFADGRPGHVIVVSIPDWGTTPFAEARDRALISRDIDRYNDHARAIAEEAGAIFHDVTVMSRRMAADPTLVVSDGLHPSGALYREWAESLVPVVASMQSRVSGS